MDDSYRVSKPDQGMQTLVAEFTFAHFDQAVEEAKDLRVKKASEAEIQEHLKANYADMGEGTLKKVYQISLGLTPKDDLSAEQITSRSKVKETTWEVELAEGVEIPQPGAVVFLEGRRWVVTSQDGNRIFLKNFWSERS